MPDYATCRSFVVQHICKLSTPACHSQILCCYCAIVRNASKICLWEGWEEPRHCKTFKGSSPAFEQRRMCMTLQEEAKAAVQKPRCCTIRANDRLCWCDQAIVAPGSCDQDISGQTLINIQSYNSMYCILHENEKYCKTIRQASVSVLTSKAKSIKKQHLSSLPLHTTMQNWFQHVLSFSMYLLKRVSLCLELEALLVCVLCMCVCVCVQYTRV